MLSNFLFSFLYVCVVERKIEKHTERFYDKAGLCSEAGYKRNETDATQFYR